MKKQYQNPLTELYVFRGDNLCAPDMRSSELYGDGTKRSQTLTSSPY